MKKVLIITNLNPHLIRASARVPGLAKYLSQFGWEAVVLTVPFPQKLAPEFRTIETPYTGDIFWFWRKISKSLGFKQQESILNQAKEKIGFTSQKSLIDRIFNLYLTIFAYPDGYKHWKKTAIKIASNILEKEKFKAIISSSSPVTAHIIASQLKKKSNIPWIADLRDLWTQNHNYSYPWWRKIFERKFEIKILSSADVLITTSQPMAEQLKELHKGKDVYTITNGFDPERVNGSLAKLTNKFTVTYTGQIYAGKQNPLKILDAIKDLISDGVVEKNEVEIRFYGPQYYWLEKEIEKRGLSAIVKQYGMVQKEISLKRQWESQILLLLNWEDEKEKGIYTGKIFEYLVAQRPILVTGGFGGDVSENLLKETKAGVSCSEIEEIKNSLKRFYLEYKQNGRVTYCGNWEEIKKYSHLEMARKFAEILNSLI